MSEKEEIPKFSPYGDRGTRAIRWRKWLRSFELFMDFKGIENPRRKKSSLLHYAGIEVQDLFETLPLPAVPEDPENVQNEYEVAVTMLTTKFSVIGNEMFESLKFRNMIPDENETMECFIVRLRQQASVCGFVNTEVERHIRDQIIVKCPFKDLRMKLIDERDALTLDRAEELCRAFEQSRLESAAIDDVSNTGELLNRLSMNNNKARNVRTSFQARENRMFCWKCGFEGHISKDIKCPAKGKKCNSCGFFGHFAKVCRATKQENKGKQKQVRTLNSESEHLEEEESEDFLFAVKALHVNKENEVIKCLVGNVEIPMIIDSGAGCNVIGKKEWEKLKLAKIKCKTYFVNKKLFAYGGSKPLKVLGAFRANVSVLSGVELKNVEFFVFDGEGSSLLSKDTAMELKVLKIGLNINVCTDGNNEDIFEKFPDVFTGVGKLKDFKLKIPIKLNVKEVAQPVRRLPYNLRPHVDKLINELIDNDIIEKVCGPTPWVSPVVVTPKKGGKWRLCVDMRVANQAIERERFPLPTIDEILYELNGSRMFSKLDIKWAYHQIELEENSRSITTFCTPMGLFRYKRLMFGVNCGPEMYQRVITQTLHDCKGVCIYMDDLIIHGKDKRDHDSNLKKVLTVLREKGLTLNKEKCEFRLDEIIFLNHHINSKGIQPTKKNQNDVENFREPKSVSEVRSFLGLVNFSSKFIPDLATIAEPLRKLTKKDEPFVWSTEQEESFTDLKRKIANPPVLGFYDSKAPTRIFCDASPVGLGAVLVQFQNGGPRIIRYASKALSSVEKRYSQTEKEALALVWACETFHIYTFGKEFELVTDHKPLETIFGPYHKSCARIERWVLRLMSYPYKVLYKSGKTNIADPLSRLLDSTEVNVKNEKQAQEEEEQIFNIVEVTVPVALSLDDMKEATRKDSNLQNLIESLKTNVWNKDQRHLELFKDEFCEIDGLVLRNTRIVCPAELQRKCLELAHEGHLGITAMKRLLRSKVWWHGIDKEVENFARTCHGCQLVAVPDPPEPMSRTELPSEPWEYIAMDHLGPLPTGEYLLVVIDYYSRFYEIVITRSLSAQILINQISEMFARYGLPKYVLTDNCGTFKDKMFGKFLKEHGCRHHYSTPLWPQANGQVERQNRSILKRLRIAHATGKNWRKELIDYLFAYRTTPHSTTGVPPADLMYGRKIRCKLPDIMKSTPYPLDENIRDHDKLMKNKGRQYSDGCRRAKVCDLMPGDTVLMRQSRENKLSTNFKPVPMTITERKGNAVTIQSPCGQNFTRNTSHLKRYLQAPPISVNSGEDTTEDFDNSPQEAMNESESPERESGQIQLNQPSIGIPRPVRDKKKPLWHKDYEVG